MEPGRRLGRWRYLSSSLTTWVPSPGENQYLQVVLWFPHMLCGMHEPTHMHMYRYKHTHSQANKIKYVYPVQSVIPTWTSMTGASSFPSSPKEPTLCPFCHLTSSRHCLCQLLHAVQLWLVFQGWDVIWFLLALGRTGQDGLQVQSPPLARTLRDLVWVSGQKLSSHGRQLFSGFKLIPQICLSVGGGRTCRLRPEITLPHAFSQALCQSQPQTAPTVFSSRLLLFKMWRFQTTGHKARDN